MLPNLTSDLHQVHVYIKWDFIDTRFGNLNFMCDKNYYDLCPRSIKSHKEIEILKPFIAPSKFKGDKFDKYHQERTQFDPHLF